MRSIIHLKVRDAMTHPAVTVSPDLTVADLEQLIERYDYNSYPVVRDGQMEGIVTKLDFLRNFVFTADSVLPHYDDLMRRHLHEIMRRDVVTVSGDYPLTRVLQMLVDLSSKSFPVVEGDRVIGIISREDVIRALRRAILDSAE